MLFPIFQHYHGKVDFSFKPPAMATVKREQAMRERLFGQMVDPTVIEAGGSVADAVAAARRILETSMSQSTCWQHLVGNASSLRRWPQ